jgi:tripartite-type tricarboxylate transporter receptor subunit TctC
MSLLRLERKALLKAFLGAVFFASSVTAGVAQPAPFYKDKTLTLLVGYTPGGLYDLTTRLISRHIKDHIPGNPAIVVQNMPGAGGTTALMYINSVAPRDGTVIGMVKRSYATDPVFGTGPKYDPTKLQPIGSTSSEVSVTATWFTSKVKTFEDTFKTEITVGTTGATDGTVRYALLAKRLTPAKLRIVSGYPGGNDVTLAVERGEVDAKFGWSWGSVKSRAKEWLDQKKINIILQMGLEKAPDLPSVPFIMDYAKTDLDKQALQLVFAPSGFAWPIVAGPGVPAERIDILRKAFDDTMKDPQFLADAEKLAIDIEPLGGKAMAQIVNRLSGFDRAVIDRATELTKPE